MRTLGIIPARMGSKEVPGKNIKLLAGRPLLSYTAQSALESRLLSRVIVSTESSEIEAWARRLGVEVPFLRPEELATDSASSIDVVRHAITHLEAVEGEKYDQVCLLQPTTPFRAAGAIDRAIEMKEAQGLDSLISVRESPADVNPYWSFVQKGNGRLGPAMPGPFVRRRQDLPQAYHRDGAIYLVDTSVAMSPSGFYGTTLGAITGACNSYINIDTMEDWLAAEEYLASLQKSGPVEAVFN